MKLKLSEVTRVTAKGQRSRGFTLIEAIIVVALFGMLMVVITEFFLGSHQIYKTQNAELDVNMSARQALDDIDAYVRQAVQVTPTYLAYNTGATTLILEVQSVNASDQLIPGSFDTIVFNLVGSSLYREVYPDAASVREPGSRLVGSSINSLAFSYDDPNPVQVKVVTTDMTISKDAGRTVQDILISSRSRLRN